MVNIPSPARTLRKARIGFANAGTCHAKGSALRLRLPHLGQPFKRWLTCFFSCFFSCFFALTAWAQEADAAAGLRILNDRTTGNCTACHALPGQTGAVSNFGPSLANVGAKYDAATLRQWVTDARQIQPDTLMPPFGSLQGTQRPNQSQTLLTSAQIAQVVAALQGFQ